MEKKQLINIKILPNSLNPVFDQRENGVFHTSYLKEVEFYSIVQSGRVDMVKQYMRDFLEKGIVIGHLSNDNLRQMQYWAVCFITMIIRYAIQGGLEEITAYNLSDSYIMAIDKMTSGEEITSYLEKTVIEVTTLVSANLHKGYSQEIMRSLNYINKHLHERIFLKDLATVSGYTESHLSKTFKKQVGKNISEYILQKKIEEAKALLRGESRQEQIAYYLGFCSQTHFISCFKKECGVTPNQYRRNR